jgi:hypothetical protein
LYLRFLRKKIIQAAEVTAQMKKENLIIKQIFVV